MAAHLPQSCVISLLNIIFWLRYSTPYAVSQYCQQSVWSRRLAFATHGLVADHC